MPQRLFAQFCFIVLLIVGCKENNNSPKFTISGTVTDAFTGEPVADATVSLLESGPSVVTNESGAFNFADADVEGVEIIDLDGSSSGAISLTHVDYNPREANIVLGQSTQVKLSPSEIPTYFYNVPVQLNDKIQTGSLSESDLNTQTIQNLMDKVVRDGYSELHSLLIYKDGLLVLEDYFFGNNDTINFEGNVTVDRNPAPVQWSRKMPHYVASVNKALTSTLVGIALDEQQVSVNDKISTYLPEYENYFTDENKADLDFEDCLTMTAGFQWDEWGSNDLSLLWKSDDFGDFVLSRDNLGADTEWGYNSALPNILLKTIGNMTGKNLREWAQDAFYGKLGIQNYKWQSQPDGDPEGAARMYITPRDMIKVGATYLNNGQWDGEQVIPEKWVKECFKLKKSTSSGDYSYYFWLRELNGIEYLSADGDGGNYINIFPEQNMVIVITQGLYLLWPSYVTQADDIMGEYILPAIE